MGMSAQPAFWRQLTRPSRDGRGPEADYQQASISGRFSQGLLTYPTAS